MINIVITVDVMIIEYFGWNFKLFYNPNKKNNIIMSSRDEVPCWSVRPKWIEKGYCEWRPVQARVHRPSSRESLLNRYILFKRGYIDLWVVSPYWTVQARVYRPLSRESLLNLYVLFKRGYIDHWVVSPYWTIISQGLKREKCYWGERPQFKRG